MELVDMVNSNFIAYKLAGSNPAKSTTFYKA